MKQFILYHSHTKLIMRYFKRWNDIFISLEPNIENIHILQTFPNAITGPSWRWYSWIYNYLCNWCPSPLTWVWISSWRGVINTTLCDKSLSVTCDRSAIFFGYDSFLRHDITEIFFKLALNTINYKPTEGRKHP